MHTEYNPQNPFAKIIRGELPTKKIYEDENTLCFENIDKAAQIHWLIIPKGAYISFDDFVCKSSKSEVADFFHTIHKIARDHGLHEKGYKLVTNNGESVGQSVFHFHVHLLSGSGLKHL